MKKLKIMIVILLCLVTTTQYTLGQKTLTLEEKARLEIVEKNLAEREARNDPNFFYKTKTFLKSTFNIKSSTVDTVINEGGVITAYERYHLGTSFVKNGIKAEYKSPDGATNIMGLFNGVTIFNSSSGRNTIYTGVDVAGGSTPTDGPYEFAYDIGATGYGVSVTFTPTPDLCPYDNNIFLFDGADTTISVINPQYYYQNAGEALVDFFKFGESTISHTGQTITLVDGDQYWLRGYSLSFADLSLNDTIIGAKRPVYTIGTSATTGDEIGESLNYVTAYAWYKDDVLMGSETDATVTASTAGEYKVTATFHDGSTRSHTITVSDVVLDPVINSVSIDTDPSCLGTELTVSANISNLGSYTTQLDYNGSSVNTGTSTSYTHTPSTTGTHTYTFKVMDGATVKSSAQATAVVYEKATFNPSVDTNIVIGGTYNVTLPDDGSVWKLNGSTVTVSTDVVDGDVLTRDHVCGNESYTFSINYYEAWTGWTPTLNHVVCNGVTPNITIPRPTNADVILKTSTGVVINGDIQLTSFGEHQIRVYHYDIDYNLVDYLVKTFNVTENSLLNVSTQITDLSYCDGETITPNALASGGAGGYDYTWDNDLVQGTESTLPVGTHTLNVTVTDDAGCTANASTTVTVHANPTVNVVNNADNQSTDIDLCEGESVTLKTDGTFANYSWTTTESSPMITVSNTGTYGVTITDENGCTATDAIVVTQRALPEFELGDAVTECTEYTINGPSLTNVSYLWSTGDETQNTTVTTSDTYSLTVTSQYGCEFSDTKGVTILESPDFTITGATAFCTGTSTTLEASNAGFSGITYSWTNETGTEVSTAASLTVDDDYIATNGNKITLTEDNGTCSVSKVVYVTINSLPTAVIDGDPHICGSDATTTLTGSGAGTGGSYTWKNESGDIISNDYIFNIHSNNPGLYTLTVTNANGCTDEASVEVTVSDDVVSKDTTLCNNDVPSDWELLAGSLYSQKDTYGCDSIFWSVTFSSPGIVNISGWDNTYRCVGDVLSMERPSGYSLIQLDGVDMPNNIEFTVTEDDFTTHTLRLIDDCGNETTYTFTLLFPVVNNFGFVDEHLDVPGTTHLEIVNVEDPEADLPNYLDPTWEITDNENINLTVYGGTAADINMGTEENATVKVTISNGCPDTKAAMDNTEVNNTFEDSIVLKNTTVGTGTDIITSKNTKIYPNPATDLVYIEMPTGENADVIEIYNQIGSLIKRTELSNKIHVSELPQGFYLIKVTSGDKSVTKRIIKR